MPRKIQYIENTLAKSSQLKLRNFFKDLFDKSKNKSIKLTKNMTEKAFFEKLGVPFKDYKTLATVYNRLAYLVNEKIDDDRRVERNAKLKQKRHKERIVKNAKIMEKITKIEKPDIMKLRNQLKKYKGKSVVVEYIIVKKVILNREYTIPDNFRSWWKKNSYDWFHTYDTDIFKHHNNAGNVFIYLQNDNLDTKRVIQLFKDGITHCVFTPIRKWAFEKLQEANAEKTKYRYSGMLKKIDKFTEQYKDGLPESNVAEICNALQIDITVELPFCETKFIEAQSMKKRLKLFRFMNARLNHLELNEVVKTDEFEIVTREELFNIKTKLDEANEFYTYKKDSRNVCSISTLSKTYKLSNKFSEVVTQFEIDTGLNFCKIDDIDDAELSKFINDGTNYNSTVDFVDVTQISNEKYEEGEMTYCEFNEKPIQHIDMKKAYANFKSCKYYSGFMGKITDFRKTDKINGIGMYLITNLYIPSGEFYELNQKLQIYMSNNIYTSVELQMLNSYGATYDIVSGCWGVNPIHFEFNNDMMNMRDDDDIPFYSKWAGVCDQHKLDKRFWIKGDIEYFKVIGEQCGNGVVKWFENGEGNISFPKKHNYHLGHITAFITAYQRISMLEQLMEINYDNVIRVCVDGIYHTQEHIQLKNVFRTKPEKRLQNQAGIGYVDKVRCKDLIINYPECRIHYSKELHLGAGGCGKTHYNLNDSGLVRVMFLAPSWKLARNKRNEIGVNCSVWARALSTDPEKISAIKENSNVLIIDEISMLNETDKQALFKTYSDMKIIMCGDLGYQLPCFDGDEADMSGFDNIVHHNTNHRCTDNRLGEILQEQRKMIREQRPKSYINNWVMKKFEEFGRIITVDELTNKYTINDMILSGTNEIKDYYTSLFTGKFENDKYYVMENNRVFCNGDIVIGEKPNCKCEIRHCFTTHSIQGETAQNNLFIDSSKMFNSRMFYTALSRAKTLDQIYIIKNTEMSFKYEYGKIYKIVSKNGIYIGSTVKPLDKRFEEHKTRHEIYKKNGGKYITSYALLDDDDVTIQKLEDFKCNDLKDLWKREAEVIQQYGNKCINKTFNENKE